MLSIGKANAAYYTNLANEDYYNRGGEKPGQWYGRGAEYFRLSGTVEPDAFHALAKGFDPDGRELVQNAGKKGRNQGWDLTFSAPKSVSEVWATAEEKERRTIERIEERAVKEALNYLQDVAGYTRKGHGGERFEPCLLTFALYPHGTSRARDPQRHIHAVVLNVGVDALEDTSAIDPKIIYRHKMAAGAIFRAEYARLLREELGIIIGEGVKRTFEVDGVPDSLTEEHSKRRQEIEAELKQIGRYDAATAAKYALSTRQKKEHAPQSELREDWRKDAERHDFDYRKVIHRQQDEINVEKAKADALEAALIDVTSGQAYFKERDLVRRVAENGQILGLGARDSIETARIYLDRHAVLLNEGDREKIYTTQSVDQMEKRMLRLVEEGRHNYAPLKNQLLYPELLNAEQRNALEFITDTPGSIKLVSGMAGTGKTTLLRSAREVWEKEGYEVRGLALASVAAKNLEKEAGIKSSSIAKFFYRIDREQEKEGARYEKLVENSLDTLGKIGRAAGAIGRTTKETAKIAGQIITGNFQGAALNVASKVSSILEDREERAEERELKRFYKSLEEPKKEKRESWKLTDKTILVVDEAAMVGTPQMSRIIEEATVKGAKIVLVGDSSQLQPIEHGNPFRIIGEKLGVAKLVEIRRQRNEEDRKTVTAFALGEVEQGITRMIERGQVKASLTVDDAIKRLVKDWSSDGLKPEEKLILTDTRETTAAINREVQNVRLEAGELSGRALHYNERTFYEGDRVVFTRNDKRANVTNGDSGTIISLDPFAKRMIVAGNSGQGFNIRCDDYDDVSLGYAITTHKGQGQTVERAYAFNSSDVMPDRHIAYVQMSRARESTTLYMAAESVERLQQVADNMGRDRTKELAQEQRAHYQASLKLIQENTARARELAEKARASQQPEEAPKISPAILKLWEDEQKLLQQQQLLQEEIERRARTYQR